MNVSCSFLVSPNLPENDIEDGYASEQLCRNDLDKDVSQQLHRRVVIPEATSRNVMATKIVLLGGEEALQDSSCIYAIKGKEVKTPSYT